jgi:hypothetical protein
MPGGVIGDMLAAHEEWDEARPLSGVFVNRQLTINMCLLARSTLYPASLSFSLHRSLSTFVRSLVRSASPLYIHPVIHREFLFPPYYLFPPNDSLIEPLLTLLNSTTANRLILRLLTPTPTTCSQ